jgi:formate-dependent nitrite reductase membrane component NrfD
MTETYYERPVLKEPVWIWAVPAYFYAGGAAGAAAVLGAAIQLAGDDDLEGLVAKCRRIAATGGAIGSALLIYDLGRPERFLNMLRVFRPSSPLSIGSWVLAGTVPLAIASTDKAGRLGDAAGLGAGLLGLPLSGYTAVLLSSTAVPAWQSARRSLPWLFVTSAAAGAASLLEATELNDKEERIVRRFGAIAKAGELIAMAAVGKEASQIERVGRPYKQGAGGSLIRTAKIAAVIGFVASSLGKSRTTRLVGAAAGTIAAAAFKWGVFAAGRESTRDPRATFELQRS